MSEQQKTALSNRFPGLDEGQIKRLLETVDAMGFSDPLQKIAKQKQLYQQVLPLVKEKEQKIGRMEVQNQLFNQKISTQSTQDFVKNDVTLRISEFTDTFRSLYHIPSTVSDDLILTTFKEVDPDFQEKLTRYLNGDKEVLQELGMAEQEDISQWGGGSRFGLLRPQEEQERNDNLFGKLKATDEATTVGGVFKEFGMNALKSTVNLASDMGNFFANPWDGIKGLGKGVLGGVANAVGVDDRLSEGSDFWTSVNETADVMGSAIAERYGSREKFSHTAYTDPVGVISDILSVLSPASGALKAGVNAASKGAQFAKMSNTASKLSKVGKAAGEIAKVADTVDPANIMMRGASKGLSYGFGKAKDGIKALDLGEKTKSIISGLDKDTRKGIQNNPYVSEYRKDAKSIIEQDGVPQDIKEISRSQYEKVGTDLLNAINRAKEAFSESGPLYQKIREVNTKVDITPALDEIKEILEKHDIKERENGSLDFGYSSIVKNEDMYAISTLLDRVNGGLVNDANTILNLRKVSDQLSKWDSGTTSEGMKVIRDIRGAIDNVAKGQIPGLAELDELYRKRIDDLNQIQEGIVYRQGDRRGQIRDNFNQIIKTIGGENRARMAERLSEIAPDLLERVSAIHGVEKLAKAYTNTPKLSKVAGPLTGAVGLGYLTNSWTGAAVGALVSYFGDSIFSKISKAHLDKIASKMSPEALIKLEEINEKIAKRTMLSEADRALLNKIKSDIENGNVNTKKEVVDVREKSSTTSTTSKAIGGKEPTTIANGQSINNLGEKSSNSYKKSDGTVVEHKQGENTTDRDFKKRQFSNKHQLPLTENLKGKTHLLEAIKVGELEKGSLSQVPAEAFYDGKARPLELTTERYEKIFKKHGPFSHENLIATANDWDYMIKDLNGQEGHINLLKELPDGSSLLIGAKRENGAVVVTHFEPTKLLKKVLDDAKKNGGEVIERGLGKLREAAKDKITLYRGIKEGGQKKFSFDAYTDNKKVAQGYGEKIISQTVSPQKLADFSNPSDELLQLVKDNWKGGEWYDLERLRGVATAEKFSMGTNMYEIFDDANVREALKNKGYDYVKFNDFGKDFKPHATYFSLKSIDAQKISKLIGNSLENNYNGVKPNRLDGEKLSIKEAETLLTKSGRNLNERIMIGIDQAGNLVLEDGRHLLEAYRKLGKEIPLEKLGFINDKAEKLFGKLYSK